MSEIQSNETVKSTKNKMNKFHAIYESFLELNATNTTHSCQLEELNIDPILFKSRILELINNNVIIRVPDTEDQYYFDEDNYLVFNIELKKRKFILIVSIVIPSALLVLLALAWVLAFT
ncbi:MAG: hypothetical protein JXA54_16175 [Candidatus Heimdallarchaeota archaeon]|nr:hypothetical protein [Candidatus Heimdallarchaeota archaeon]